MLNEADNVGLDRLVSAALFLIPFLFSFMRFLGEEL